MNHRKLKCLKIIEFVARDKVIYSFVVDVQVVPKRMFAEFIWTIGPTDLGQKHLNMKVTPQN